MSWDERNLCITKRAHVRGSLVRQWCTVGHAINPLANGGRARAWDHRWQDGHCLDCHKTVEDVLVPEAEKMRATLGMEARGAWGD